MSVHPNPTVNNSHFITPCTAIIIQLLSMEPVENHSNNREPSHVDVIKPDLRVLVPQLLAYSVKRSFVRQVAVTSVWAFRLDAMVLDEVSANGTANCSSFMIFQWLDVLLVLQCQQDAVHEAIMLPMRH